MRRSLWKSIAQWDFLKDQGVADPQGFRVKATPGNEIALIVSARWILQEEVAIHVGLAPLDVSRTSTVAWTTIPCGVS